MGPEVGSCWSVFQKSCLFGKTPYGKIFKNSFRKDSSGHRSTYCVQILWNLTDQKSVKSCIVYRTKKTKFPLALSLLLLRRSRPNLPGPVANSECPKFHPNRFTSGRVIAKRVSTVQTCHKVFPIFGKATASSPGGNYPAGLPQETPTMHWILNNTQLYQNSRLIFNRQKSEGGHSPQMISAIGRGHCGQKLYAGSRGWTAENFARLDKIHLFYVSFIVYQFSP